MTTDDIVRMAREVNLWDTFDDDSNNMLGKYVVLERFASLVAAAEREECARVVEQAGIDGYGTLAAAILIRERGAP
jgi:hypothetical protein